MGRVVLGVDAQRGAARLTRALLADPLAPEPSWERHLVDSADENGKAILLRYSDPPRPVCIELTRGRYAENFKVDRGHPLVETLFVPSSILHSHNLEILVQKTSVDNESRDPSSLLVPSLETPGSYGGRMSLVTYPVHKVIIYADNLGSLPAIGNAQYVGSMIQRVVNGTWSALQPSGGQSPSIIPINLDLGELAIETFRKSIERAIEFEHTWYDSGMASVAFWLSEGTSASPDSPKPSLRRLIELISISTTRSIKLEEETQLKEAKALEISTTTKDALDRSISTWSENAHTELRDRLGSVFHSKSWRKTKWWKLFWRVDEVGFITSNILNRAWLVEAEKEMIWLSGRIQQSGLLGIVEPKPRPQQQENHINDDAPEVFTGPRESRIIDVLDDVKPFEPDEEEIDILHPWPQNITSARTSLSRTTIPSLQTLSQTLMLQSVSTTFLTSTLSVLAYIGVSSTSAYEAGTIAALGLVFALRRLQKNWEGARKQWQNAVQEAGRTVLRKEEQLLRDTVKRGGDVPFDFESVKQRKIASEALVEIEDALQKNEANGGDR